MNTGYPIIIVHNSLNELYHHGIEGQKWGVRNGPPYPLSRNKNVRRRSQKDEMNNKPLKDRAGDLFNLETKDLTVPKGVITSRISLSPIENVKGVRKYISLEKKPEQTWIDMFTKGYDENLYILQYRVSENMKVASSKNAIDGLYKWINSSENPRELVRGINYVTEEWANRLGFNRGDNLVSVFFNCIGAQNRYTREYFNFMKEQGYDAIADVFGIRSGGDKSIIVINPDECLQFLGSELIKRGR